MQIAFCRSLIIHCAIVGAATSFIIIGGYVFYEMEHDNYDVVRALLMTCICINRQKGYENTRESHA